jgi:hypothetical protein
LRLEGSIGSIDLRRCWHVGRSPQIHFARILVSSAHTCQIFHEKRETRELGEESVADSLPTQFNHPSSFVSVTRKSYTLLRF